MGVEEIKAHPFFAGIDWKSIRKGKAFNVPELKGDVDTKYFEEFPEELPWIDNSIKKKAQNRKVEPLANLRCL